ncbi:30S ribosomal protein S21 [Cardinium endosymbiont of Culicoides punctatus]|uniref:30S ribosomal protein S21 n=1 Tax=Cardinium endosymbiont of Culicoides punctatus TaxID=2304601 RepID=UPI0010590DD6|nr:30S ribosomal protein S21 [Cardinium endosymbiont of Culicoides punctatus]TDG93368.1 30S ribosomal protein S21 [Cardinium endosymbiont of Culicoides punctatus]
MIFVEVKEQEGLDRALKRFKKKIERVRVLKQARARMHYVKPTMRRKAERARAIYRSKMQMREV